MSGFLFGCENTVSIIIIKLLFIISVFVYNQIFLIQYFISPFPFLSTFAMHYS
jgi:hypothetical protein